MEAAAIGQDISGTTIIIGALHAIIVFAMHSGAGITITDHDHMATGEDTATSGTLF